MLQLAINQNEGTPIYLQLVRQIKHLIATGRLDPGEELPPVRVLAQQLLINPNTAARAYRELEAAGLVNTKRGSGTYVGSQRVPYSDGECRRILVERVDALIVESRSLGYSLDKVVGLLLERDRELHIGKDSRDTTEEARRATT